MKSVPIRRAHDVAGAIKITIPKKLATAFRIFHKSYVRWRVVDYQGTKIIAIFPEDVAEDVNDLLP
jgi:hypothetical protein